MLDVDDMERRILAMASETFPDGVIHEVHCERDLDHVHEPVVWVRFVVAEGAMPFRMDREHKLDFGVRLTRAFGDWGDPAYPVTFFYPESEYRSLYSAAA